MPRSGRGISLGLGVVLLLSALNSQAPTAFAQVASGTPPFGSFGGGPDIVNIGNVNVHLDANVLSKVGRELPLRYALTYDSSPYYPVGSSGNQTWTPVSVPGSNVPTWGWAASITNAPSGYVTYGSTQGSCNYMGTWYYWTIYAPWIYWDSTGAGHYFSGATISSSNGPCGPTDQSTNSATATGTGDVCSMDSPACQAVFIAQRRPPVSAHQRRKHDGVRGFPRNSTPGVPVGRAAVRR